MGEEPDPLEGTRSLVDWLTGQPEPDPVQPQIAPVFDSVTDWVEKWLACVLELKAAHGSQGGANWCPRWFDHPQVVLRLTAAWREWETARVTESMSRWWNDHWDGHLAAVIAENGPLARCRTEHTLTIAPLETATENMRADLEPASW